MVDNNLSWDDISSAFFALKHQTNITSYLVNSINPWMFLAVIRESIKTHLLRINAQFYTGPMCCVGVVLIFISFTTCSLLKMPSNFLSFKPGTSMRLPIDYAIPLKGWMYTKYTYPFSWLRTIILVELGRQRKLPKDFFHKILGLLWGSTPKLFIYRNNILVAV